MVNYNGNKYIFESEEEKEKYFIDYCPPNYGICHDLGIACAECWKQSGVQIEIKPYKEESIKMTTEEKQFTYTDCVYELVKDECKGMDSIYEDYIVSLVGNCGLAALKRAGLLEACGVLNCRQLYVLVDRVLLPKGHIEIDIDEKDAKWKTYDEISGRIYSIRSVDEFNDIYEVIESALRTEKISRWQYLSLKHYLSKITSRLPIKED